MNVKKITEVNLRHAQSPKTHPSPYEDSRRYRKEKSLVNLNASSPKSSSQD